jgi:hypothetical protein
MLEAVSRKLEISEQTFHRWQHIYDGTKEPEMARLKKIVAKEAMDTGAMKSPPSGHSWEEKLLVSHRGRSNPHVRCNGIGRKG